MRKAVSIILSILLAVAGVGAAGQFETCASAVAYKSDSAATDCCCKRSSGMHQACACCTQTSESEEVVCDCSNNSPLLFVSAFHPAVSGLGALRADVGERVESVESTWAPLSIIGGAPTVEYGPIEVLLRTCSFLS